MKNKERSHPFSQIQSCFILILIDLQATQLVHSKLQQPHHQRTTSVSLSSSQSNKPSTTTTTIEGLKEERPSKVKEIKRNRRSTESKSDERRRCVVRSEGGDRIASFVLKKQSDVVLKNVNGSQIPNPNPFV